MRSYERSGVVVDQCTQCRGIFLDRGELEKLVDAEAAFNAGPAPVASVPASPSAPTGPPARPAAPVGAGVPAWGSDEPRYDGRYDDRYDPLGSDRYDDDRHRERRSDDDRYRDDRYRDDRYREQYKDRGYAGGDPRYRTKKRKSFLEELFD